MEPVGEQITGSFEIADEAFHETVHEILALLETEGYAAVQAQFNCCAQHSNATIAALSQLLASQIIQHGCNLFIDEAELSQIYMAAVINVHSFIKHNYAATFQHAMQHAQQNGVSIS